jgi:hypothetical protein
MHLLNTLPQRLDPGATPTFAGLIAPSLTSPAASPLTLGTGTSGAAITVLSASNFVGIGTTTPAQKLQVGSTADATSNFIRIATDSSRSQGISFLRSGSIETVLAVVSQKLQYAINPASNADADLVAASKFTIDNAGITTIANSTAGSAGAGALVVTGGLSAGNNGNASYFGGAVTVGGNGGFPTLFIGADGLGGGGANRLIFNYEGNAGSRSWRLVNDQTGFGDFAIQQSTTRTGSTYANALLIDSSLAATFGGNIVVAQDKFSNFDGSGAARMGMQAVSTAPYSVRMLGSADAVNTRDFSFGYYTGDNAANAWNQKAAINSYTGAATFAGEVTISKSSNQLSLNTTDTATYGFLNIGHFTNGTFIGTTAGSNAASNLLRFGTSGTARLTIAADGAATFTGAVRMSAYGAGAATFDSSGNITSVSDARLKNITGTFTKGLAEIVKLTPKLYTWKPETGLVTDDINATLIAQDLIAAGLSEAVATYRTVPVMEDDVQSTEDIAAGKPVTQHAKLDANGKAVTKRVDANYSVSDRTVIAALVNAVKELKAEIDALKAAK